MKYIRYEKSNNIVILTISRKEVLNALNYEVLGELENALDTLNSDRDAYCAIITGDGDKAFVAGADIAQMKDMSVSEARAFSLYGNAVYRKIELLDIPVLAAINGYALGGGCELALSCDIRLASDSAVFGQPEASLGVTPGYGATQRLSRVVGIGKAKELLYTGMKINADEALKIGLVNGVVPKESLMAETLSTAEKIAKNAPIAVKFCKVAVNKGMQCDIDTALAYEAELFAQCFASEDQKEAMKAFLEKRKVEKFKGR